MGPTLAPRHPVHAARDTTRDATAGNRAAPGRAAEEWATRDWAEIQERTLVPLYQAVYARLEVGPHTRLLGLGCGSGLALLLAAARGAVVTGVEHDQQRLELARERLLPPPQWGARPWPIHVLSRDLDGVGSAGKPAPNLLTAFDPHPGAAEPTVTELARAAALLQPGSPVVLGGWGAPERCAAAPALELSTSLAGPVVDPDCWRPAGADALPHTAREAGLLPGETAEVPCPFGYADLASAVRGLLSTGCYQAALRTAGRERVIRELTEAVRPHLCADGTVWMPNAFRYLVAHTPCPTDDRRTPPRSDRAGHDRAPGRAAEPQR